MRVTPEPATPATVPAKRRERPSTVHVDALCRAAREASDWLCAADVGTDQRERGDQLRDALNAYEASRPLTPLQRELLAALVKAGKAMPIGAVLAACGREAPTLGYVSAAGRVLSWLHKRGLVVLAPEGWTVWDDAAARAALAHGGAA